ncbi:DUF1697 domain-containing protein [Actinoplanes sp. KI2]|uniref:DUF1697 domain-containing protein n=1 Tax=Actinoplanes sp. KI2 TaxID=2983315 RepID=UPI0021D58DB7|nr:DUF1697 domain-containing protein [Actinoplanes sp. KI2]MCU7725927.1 DUF1697 domain-containing protein [Actinoplanes sp. KI2]
MTQAAVAFLRGVNLGPRNKVPQRALAERLAEATGAPVRHHLQSGNLVVAAPTPELASVIRELIDDDTGLDIPVVVRTAAELADLLEACPWPGEDPRRVHLSMWDDEHDRGAAGAMTAADWSGDEIAFAGRNAWMRYATGFHRAKLGNHVVERRLGVTATARNADTIRAVLELTAQIRL